MALVRKIQPVPRNSRVQSETACTYNTLVSGGQKYLQLNTYGSKERQHADIVSQTIQFNRQAAKELFEILRKEFDL